MANQITIEIDAELSQVSSLREKIIDFINQNQINDKSKYEIILAITEVYTNIIIHGYQNKPGNSVTVSLKRKSNQLECNIIDSAPEFILPNDLNSIPQENTINGYGLKIIKELTDSFKIDYQNKHNSWFLNFSV